MEEAVLISACLLGEACRHDGKTMPCAAVIAFAREHRVAPVCPEQLGGLPTPRAPSEIQTDGCVVDAQGRDRTAAFKLGATETLRIAREQGCTHAILKANSPSCGVKHVYDGTFSGKLEPGMGITARTLQAAGIDILDETDLEQCQIDSD